MRRKINNYSKRKLVLKSIKSKLNLLDRIILNAFPCFTINIYRIGLRDAFKWNNKK